MAEDHPVVGLRSWREDDLPLLERLLGDPATTAYLGGPETPEKVRSRHGRYLGLADPAADCVFAVVVGVDETPAGWVGYWESEWQGEAIWEIGWSVLPEFQGRDLATEATALAIATARAAATHRFMHAFPSVDNAASNSICRKVGFLLLGVVDIEYPSGNPMRSNDWCLDLVGEAAVSDSFGDVAG